MATLGYGPLGVISDIGPGWEKSLQKGGTLTLRVPSVLAASFQFPIDFYTVCSWHPDQDSFDVEFTSPHMVPRKQLLTVYETLTEYNHGIEDRTPIYDPDKGVQAFFLACVEKEGVKHRHVAYQLMLGEVSSLFSSNLRQIFEECIADLERALVHARYLKAGTVPSGGRKFFRDRVAPILRPH